MELTKIMEEKRQYRSFLHEKQRKKREEEKKELKNVKKEAEIWKFINKKRGKGPRLERGDRLRKMESTF